MLARLGKEGAKMSLDDIQQGYKRIEQDFKASAKGAKDVCAEVFYEFHPVKRFFSCADRGPHLNPLKFII